MINLTKKQTKIIHIEYMDGGTLAETAKRHGVNKAALSAKFKKHGLPLKQCGSLNGMTPHQIEKRNDRMLKLRQKGKTFQEIADIYGLRVQRVGQILWSIPRGGK